MAVTFEELKAVAEGTGLKFVCDPEKQLLLFGSLGSDKKIYHLLVKWAENGEALYFRIPSLTVVPQEHPMLGKVLTVLMTENDRVKVGRFCYDPDDGEIYLDWFLPLEDAPVTNQQLERCLKTLFVLAEEVKGRLEHLLETGEDLPPERQGLRGLLRRLLTSTSLSEEEGMRLRRLLRNLESGNAEGSERTEEIADL